MANYKGLAIGAYGGIAETSLTIRSGQYLRFSTPPTTPPTTGLTIGDMFLVLDDTTTGTQLAVCVDSANNSLRYIPFGTATFSRATP